MAAMQGSGRGQGLIERAEHHREDHSDGPMKATNRVAQGRECSATAATTHA